MSDILWTPGGEAFAALARTIEAKHPDEDPATIAARVLRRMTGRQRMDLLIALGADAVDSIRRARVREIERRAAADQTAAVERARRAAARDNVRRLRSDPAARDEYRAARDAEKAAQHERGIARRADWARRKADREEQERERERWIEGGGFFGHLRRVMETYRDAVRLELTEELLGASFALGDGTSVTWGEATRDQHRQRLLILAESIEGTGRTMVLHQKAIEMLDASGAARLNDVRVAA